MKLRAVFAIAILCTLTAACSQATQVLPTDTLTPSEAPTRTRFPTRTKTTVPTLKPTWTPRPSNTPKPTNTTKPTDTPQAPVILTGTGDSVIDFGWSGPGILFITYSGRSNFTVKSYDADGNYLDLLVNTIGSYKGTVPLNFIEQGAVRFEVNASGNWEIKVTSLSEIRHEEIPGTITGTGDDVIYLSGKNPDLLKVDASMADSNFVIWAYSPNDLDLLVNEIAPYTGTVVALKDMYLIVVKAEGDWSIEVTTR